MPGAADPQALNRYSYVLNNPLRYTDPSGHCIPDITCTGQDDNENTDQIDGTPPGGGGGEPDLVCVGPYLPVPCTTPGPTPGSTSIDAEVVFIDATRECNLTKVLGCALVGGWEKLQCWPPPAPVQGGLGATTCNLSSGGGFFAQLGGEKSWEGDHWAIEMHLELCNSSNVQQFCASDSKYVANVSGYTYDLFREVTEDEELDAGYSVSAGSFDYGGVLELKEDPSYLEISFFIADAGLRKFYYDFNNGLTYPGPVRNANLR